jgi:hypothetical protein
LRADGGEVIESFLEYMRRERDAGLDDWMLKG